MVKFNDWEETKQAFKRHGMSTFTLMRKDIMVLSGRTIQNIRRGTENLRLGVIGRVCSKLDMDLNEFLHEEGCSGKVLDNGDLMDHFFVMYLNGYDKPSMAQEPSYERHIGTKEDVAVNCMASSINPFREVPRAFSMDHRPKPPKEPAKSEKPEKRSDGK